jgi:ABC-type transport system substrate-binding protein
MKSRPRASIVVLALTLAVTVIAAGCGTTSAKSSATPSSRPALGGTDVVKPDGTPTPGGTLVYGIEGESNGWNPTSARWTEPALTEASAVFDPLVAWDAQLQPKPYLAQAVTPHANYTVWDITLRPGIKFHDGTPLDATAVAGALNAEKASVLTSSSFQLVDSISVKDPTTVELKMNSPWVALPAALTSQIGMIAAPSQIASGDTQKPIGTGPFTYGQWIPNNVFQVKKNPSYWRKGLPYLAEIDFKPIPEAQTLYDSLLSGDVSAISTSNSPMQNKLRAQATAGHIQLLYSVGETEENMVQINTQAPPLSDLRVRQALAYSSNIAHMAQVQGFDPRQIADGPFAPGSQWDVPTGYPHYNLAKAKQLVSQVEASNGGKPVTFDFQCIPDAFVVQACQLLQSDWKAAGIDAHITTVTEDKLISNALSGDYQTMIWRLFGAQDPDSDTLWWNGNNTKPPLALNMARNVDPKLDAAIYVGRTSDKAFNRKLAYITVARRLAADLPYIWIDHSVWVVAANNSVHGLDKSTMPDGSPAAPIVSGIERLGQVWVSS